MSRVARSMVIGMATKKVTITLDEQDIAAVKAMVAAGRVASVSGFVQHAVRVALDDAEIWNATFEDWLAATGGPITDQERALADSIMDLPNQMPSP